MNQNTLIVGKNSKIVKELKLEKYPWITVISNNDLHDGYNFSGFQRIWIFSWSHKSLQENKRIAELLPLDRSVFISTTAVNSLAIRWQWNCYPRWKAELEKIYLSAGARVVRLGVFGNEHLRNSVGLVPFTTIEQLRNAVVKGVPENLNVYQLIELKNGGLYGLRKWLALFLYSCARTLPSKKIFQVPFEAISKFLLKTSCYGYTADANLCFQKNTLIGYGALGSAFDKLGKIRDLRVTYSLKKNIMLDQQGFKGTRIGRHKTGLAKFWHGVGISSINEKYIKNVPLLNVRPKVPSSAIPLHINRIIATNDSLYLYVDCERAENLIIETKVAYLAAGPLVNCQLLQSVDKINCYFSDHEIGTVGTVSSSDQGLADLVKSTLGIIRGRGVLNFKEDGIQFLLDFRPLNITKHNQTNENIYNDTTLNIIFKLMKRMSFMQINEALFNKFGVAFATNRLSAFVQVVSHDCILLDSASELSRSRLEKHSVDKVKAIIKSKFLSFQADENVELVDGQHIMGGKELLESPKIQALIASGRLHILGSPTHKRLDAFHHTRELISDIKNQYFN
jgi:hypothetical protein